ncbi:MAG: type IV pilus assembly protein PilM [Candidatus Atribacteria bacterium]|nr:MAG: type IV pilus assembly protein PilM [Candidatus Atribacteria bacterium]
MFAIDFGARSIKVAKLHKAIEGYELVNYGVALSPEGAIVNGDILNPIVVADVLTQLIRDSGIRDNKAIIAITGQKVIIREITLPIMEDKELMAGVMWEAPKYVPYDLDESIIDAEKIDEFVEKDGNKMMRVLLVAAPKVIIQPYMEVLKKARIRPKVVDIVSSADIRAFKNHLTGKEEENEESLINIILSIGATSTILTLVEKNNLKFTRNILIGGNDINKAIAKSLNISFDEAEKLKREAKMLLGPETEGKEENESEKIIAKILNQITKEVRKSLGYYKTQSQKVKYNKIILSGGCANINNIEALLSEQFEMPVIIGNPLEDIKINQSAFDIERIKKLKNSLATVFGLAMRER